jgi:hypothetical protein
MDADVSQEPGIMDHRGAVLSAKAAMNDLFDDKSFSSDDLGF